MNPLYIYHHMGLGDHLICNALVREFAEEARWSYRNKMVLFCKPEYLETVKFMYRDLDDLKFGCGSDYQVEQFLATKNPKDIRKIGFNQMNSLTGHFDERFYKLANIPFNYRWNRFYCQRSLIREIELYEKLGIKKNQYIFVHDDDRRNLTINTAYIKDSSLPIIRPRPALTSNIFDWLLVIQNAKEVHCMDSCFFHLVEIPKMEVTDQLYYHAYLKGYSIEGMPSFRKKWIVL